MEHRMPMNPTRDAADDYANAYSEDGTPLADIRETLRSDYFNGTVDNMPAAEYAVTSARDIAMAATIYADTYCALIDAARNGGAK